MGYADTVAANRVGPNRRLRAGIVATLVTGWVFLAPSAADAYLYWSNSATNSIGRANLDGTGVDTSFIPAASTPIGVAADDDYVYWANNNGFSVGRAALDGTGVDQSLFAVATGNFVRGIDVDENYVYAALANDLGRADLDGSNVDETFIDDPGTYFGVAVDDQHVYFTAFSNAISRADLDGTNVSHTFITGASGARHVEVDRNHVFWTNRTGNTIGRANLDGSNADQSFITGAASPTGLAIDDDHVYWTNDNGTIGRANLDGSGVDQSFITGVSTGSSSELAVDELTPPATHIDSVDLKRAKRKARIGFDSSQPGSTFTCKLDRRAWKSCESPVTYRRLNKRRHKVKVVARNAQNADDPTPAKVRFKL